VRQSKAEIYLHLIWTTWQRQPFLTSEIQRAVFRCIEQEAQRLSVIVLAIGGMADHVHLAVKLPTRISVAQLAHQVKGVSSHFAHDQLPGQEPFRWQSGYGVFSLGRNQVKTVISYIANQQSHHTQGTIWPQWEDPETDIPDASRPPDESPPAGRLAVGPIDG